MTTTIWVVGCENFREALSARLDGEAETIAATVLDQHLTACAHCRAWYRDAQKMRRWMAVRPAPPVPDLTETILERIPAPTGQRWPARIALGIVAFAQLTLAVIQLLGLATGMGATADGGFMVEHLSHESTAWNLAIGVGLLCAALRTTTARGQLPALAGFVAVLTILSVLDLTGHDVTISRLLTHLPVVLGLALLYVVHRQHRDDPHLHPSRNELAKPKPQEGIDTSTHSTTPDPTTKRSSSRPPASRRTA